MILFLIMAFTNPSMTLQGEARPILLAGTPQAMWVLRQPEGKMPRWWMVTAGESREVPLPFDARMAAPLPNGEGIVSVQKERITVWKWRDNGWQAESSSWRLEQPILSVTPRIDSVFEAVGAQAYLPIFTGRHLSLFRYGTESKLLGPVVLPNVQDEQQFSIGERAFLQPKASGYSEGLVWITAGKAYVWRESVPETIETLNPPLLSNMEQAAAAHVGGQFFWLINGGKRGDLSSFGWRLTDKTGSQTHGGKGILVRFNRLDDSLGTRLMAWTVSQKIRRQLWAAVSGSRTFSAQTLIWKQSSWRSVGTIQVKMAKGSGEKAFELMTQADVNQDGLLDLVAIDEKQGIRLFPSKQSGQFGKAISLDGSTPDEALHLQRQLYLAYKHHASWQLQKVVVP